MNFRKYIFLVLLLTFIEIIISYFLFIFVSVNKTLYIIFSLIIVFALSYYLLSIRIAEKVKLKGKKEVILSFFSKILNIVKVLIFIFLISVFLRALILVLFNE